MKILMLIIPLCLFMQMSYAQQHNINDVKMSITLPDTYLVITQQTNEESLFQQLGYTKQNMLLDMKNNNIYLEAINYDIPLQLRLIVIENSYSKNIEDTRVDPSFLNENSYKLEYQKAQQKKFNITIQSFSTYENKDALYGIANGVTTINGINYCILNYTTFRNGRGIILNFSSTGDKKNILTEESRKIVDNIIYNEKSTYSNKKHSKENISNYNSNNTISDRAFERGFIKGLGAMLLIGLFYFVSYIWKKYKN